MRIDLIIVNYQRVVTSAFQKRLIWHYLPKNLTMLLSKLLEKIVTRGSFRRFIANM